MLKRSFFAALTTTSLLLGGQCHAAPAGDTRVAKIPAQKPGPRSVATDPPAATHLANGVVETTLANGMKLVCRPEPGVPLVALQVFVRVGSGQETEGLAGIGSFVARTLTASTTTRSPDTISAEIRDLGGNLVVNRQPDWTQISVLTVPDRFTNAMDLITDVLKDATFDSDVVEDKRQEILADIDSGEASPFDRTYTNLRKAMFAGTGYGLPALGTPRSIRHLQREQLVAYYNRYFVPKNYVVVVAGDVDPDVVRSTIEHDMADYNPFLRGSRRGDPSQTVVPQLSDDVQPVHAVQPDLNQVCLMVGYRAPSMSSEDYAALQVINALLGGMKSSRLFTAVREKQGLAYQLGSFYTPMIYAGDFTGYVFAAPTRLDPQAKKRVPTLPAITAELKKQFDSLETTPPTEAELTRAKHYVIGSYKIKHERIQDRAYLLGIAELTASDGARLDTNFADYVNAVTVADIQRVAKKFFVHPAISVLEPPTGSEGMITE